MRYFYRIFCGCFFVGFQFILLNSCSKFDKEEPIPSYISIRKIDLVVPDSLKDKQGSASASISDAWIYIDDKLQGVYQLPAKFPEEFLKIHTATPTDSSTKTPIFESFAANYINGLNKLYTSPKDDLTKNYNAFVQGCVDCHHAFCPGPIKAINKLKI